MTKATSQSWTVKAAVLSISLILTSAPAINGALPFMQAAMGTDAAQNEILSTLPSLAVIVFIFLSSWFERKLGMKRVICLGLLLAGCAGIVPMFTSEYPIIFASRLVLGCGVGLYNSLAVSLINTLYTGNTRATLLGFRNSMESIGQTVLTLVAGLLLTLGWHWSFAIYLFAFPVMVFFWLTLPETSDANASANSTAQASKAQSDNRDERMNPFVYVLMLFAVIQVLNSLSMTVRFPAVAAQIMGSDYNSSFLLSLMPMLGIVSGFMFGLLNKYMGKYVLYLGLIIYVVADVLMGFSNGSFALAITGLFLSGFPGSLCFPYIFNTLGDITAPRTATMATSLIFVGCNIGNFAAPIVMNGIQAMLHTDSLTVPFPVYAMIFLLILIGVAVHDARLRVRMRVIAS